MKKKIEINQVNECIKNGINTANKIAKKLNFSCAAIMRFCKKNNINLNKESRGGQNFIDLSGRTINGVKILSRIASDKTLSPSRAKLAKWKCQCPCGKIFDSVGSDIRLNRVKTCGCRISIVSKRNWQGGEFVSKKYWRELNSNAEKRGFKVDITINDLDELLQKQNFKCSLSKIDLIFSGTSLLHTASLDRIDSSKPYTKDNIQWVHKEVQIMKNKYSQEHFVEMCKKIAKAN